MNKEEAERLVNSLEPGNFIRAKFLYLGSSSRVEEASFILKLISIEDEGRFFFKILKSDYDISKKNMRIRRQKLIEELQMPDSVKRYILAKHSFWAFVSAVKVINYFEKISELEASLEMLVI